MIKHPLLNEDSPHYKLFDEQTIYQFEKMFTKDELMAWAKLNYFKYMFRLGKKDTVQSELKKMTTYEKYWLYLKKLTDENKDNIQNISKHSFKSATHSLYEEVEADKLTSEVIKKECDNPFKKDLSKKYHKWTKDDISTLKYVLNTNIESHKTIEYLKRKLPKGITQDAISSKVRRLGGKIIKGKVWKKS